MTMGDVVMLRTIMIGSRIMAQGQYVKMLTDGRMVVRVDGRLMVGHPVTQDKAA
ncbi:hypothetical protein SAMN04488527_11555 [Aliiroseovarius crassostreae]|nr:hypothetical protein SAMN04488527_11555 [Aliiroseovarius crassostreae]